METGEWPGFTHTFESSSAAGAMPERLKPPSAFEKIQIELHQIVMRSVDDKRQLSANELDKIKDLKAERAPIINKANQIGLFDNLDRQAREIILNAEDTDQALATLSDIDAESLEIEETGKPGWDHDFRGMLEEQKGMFMALIQRSEAKAHGDPTTSEDYIHRDRVLTHCSWGTLPVTLADNLAKKTEEQRKAKAKAAVPPAPVVPPRPRTPRAPRAPRTPAAPALNSRDLAKEIARAQGLQPPEAVLEEFRDGEEHLKPTQVIAPGSEPRFWLILTENEKQAWYVRSTLMIIGYKKGMAKGTDELYLDAMRELGVDLNKRSLKILFGTRVEDRKTHELRPGEYRGVDGVLPATGIYNTIIGDIKFREYSKPTDLSLKDVLCKNVDSRSRKSLEDDYGQERAADLADLEKLLYERCPDSIYHHDESYVDADGKRHKWGTDISQESFTDLRKSIRLFLMTKGRNLLLTDEELAHRDEFFDGRLLGRNGGRDILLNQDPDKKPFMEMTPAEQYAERKNIVYRLMERRARDAEQIAWNFTFGTSLLESFDSRQFRPAGTRRHPPSNFWTLFQWMAMHPQERFEQKIVRGGREAKEEWAGSLGTWAINNFTNNPNWFETVGGKRVFKFPDDQRVLPDSLIRSALQPSNYEGSVRIEGTTKTKFDPNVDKDCLFNSFNKVGNQVLFFTDEARRPELENIIDWSNVSDSPFVPFVYDEMRWADVVLGVFKKGSGSKLGFADIGEAMRNLRLTPKTKEQLIMIYDGINPHAPVIKPKEGAINWAARKMALREYFPNLFLEK